MNIHWDPNTGEIHGWDNSHEPTIFPGLNLLVLDVKDPPDPKLVKIANGEFVPKSAEEIRVASLPHEAEVLHSIWNELSVTDQYMESDRNISNEKKAEWAQYRQALRDLSKLEGVEARIKAWPIRPDGKDAIPRLRERVE